MTIGRSPTDAAAKLSYVVFVLSWISGRAGKAGQTHYRTALIGNVVVMIGVSFEREDEAARARAVTGQVLESIALLPLRRQKRERKEQIRQEKKPMMMKILLKFTRAAVWPCLLIVLSSAGVFAQTETIESLTEKIEANPKKAGNYLTRAELYFDLADEKEFPENLPLVARSVADYTAYLRLKPNDAQALRMRARARGELFIETNPFAASDTRRAFALNPRDLEARDELRVYAAEYPKFHRSQQCRRARVKNGFRDHPSDDPLTALGEALDVQLTADKTVALKYLACGANPNHVYPQSGQPEIFDFIFFRVEHLVALLEAGANPNRTDRLGRTPLMKSLDALVQSGNAIDDEALEKFRLLLDYGANPSARARSGQTVLALARQTKNKRLIDLFVKRGAK